MAMSCGKKTNLLRGSANGHDDPQICGQEINFPICLWLSKFALAIIGCQKTNFPCCVTRQKAVFCGQINSPFSFVKM